MDERNISEIIQSVPISTVIQKGKSPQLTSILKILPISVGKITVMAHIPVVTIWVSWFFSSEVFFVPVSNG